MIQLIKNPSFHNSYRSRDFFLHYQKNRPKSSEYVLTEAKHREIITAINALYKEALAEGKTVFLPQRVGLLEPVKYMVAPKLKDNKLILPPVDWKETRALWRRSQEDAEAKTLIRRKSGYQYVIRYKRRGRPYKNQQFVRYYPVRDLITLFQNNVRDNKIKAAALWIEQ